MNHGRAATWRLGRRPGRWLRSFGLMVIWEARSLRMVLPLAVVAQIILGAGLVIGFGFLLGDIPMTEALFLASDVGTSFGVLGGWAVAAWIVTAWVVARRS